MPSPALLSTLASTDMPPLYGVWKSKMTDRSAIGLGLDLAVEHVRDSAEGTLRSGRENWPGSDVADIK